MPDIAAKRIHGEKYDRGFKNLEPRMDCAFFEQHRLRAVRKRGCGLVQIETEDSCAEG
jgi:hypothetical protein